MKKLFFNILVSGLLLFVMLFLVEIILKLAAPLHFTGFTNAYQYDADLGYRAMPGHHLALTDYQQELYVNHLGTINFQDDFRGYDVLIFAAGDSYTQGTGLYSDASYPFQLDLILNVRNDGGKELPTYSKKFAVVNLGLAAYGGEQSYLVLKRYMNLIGDPDIVLYIGGDTDAADDALFKSGIRHKNVVRDNPAYGWMFYPINFVFYKTEIGKRLRYIVQEKVIRKSARDKTASETTGESVAQNQIVVIKRIIALANQRNAAVILSWADDSPSYEWLKKWAMGNHIAFADWRPLVHDVSANMKNLPLKNPHSGRHYRTWVNTMIALSFKNEIENIKKD